MCKHQSALCTLGLRLSSGMLRRYQHIVDTCPCSLTVHSRDSNIALDRARTNQAAIDHDAPCPPCLPKMICTLKGALGRLCSGQHHRRATSVCEQNVENLATAVQHIDAQIYMQLPSDVMLEQAVRGIDAM
jgi:hypothetical protein